MDRPRRLLWALAANGALVVAQVIGGISAHSIGLLADGGHNLIDVVGLGLAALAAHLVTLPASDTRSYGNHRSGILAALANAALLSLVTTGIVVVGVERLIHPVEVHGPSVAAIAGGALVVNSLSALVVRDRSADLNMRGAFLHMVADIGAAGAVLAAGIVVIVAGQGAARVDPAASLAVALIILVEAVKLAKQSADILLESTPSDIDVRELERAVIGLGAVEAIHDVHVWSLSARYRALSAHLVLTGRPTLQEAQLVARDVRSLMAERFAIPHATLELECEACETSTDPDLHRLPIEG